MACVPNSLNFIVEMLVGKITAGYVLVSMCTNEMPSHSASGFVPKIEPTAALVDTQDKAQPESHCSLD